MRLTTCMLIIIGQPVGWCISDRETTEIIEVFFDHLKQQSPDTSVKVLMTDDGKFVLRVNYSLYQTNHPPSPCPPFGAAPVIAN